MSYDSYSKEQAPRGHLGIQNFVTVSVEAKYEWNTKATSMYTQLVMVPTLFSQLGDCLCDLDGYPTFDGDRFWFIF